MPEKLRMETIPHPAPGIAVIRLEGILDGHGGRILMSACGAERSAGRSVVLVLRDVTFVSSSGIGVLLALTEDFRDRGLRLGLASPSKEVRMAVGLLNLEHYLRLYDSEHEAMLGAAA